MRLIYHYMYLYVMKKTYTCTFNHISIYEWNALFGFLGLRQVELFILFTEECSLMIEIIKIIGIKI